MMDEKKLEIIDAKLKEVEFYDGCLKREESYNKEDCEVEDDNTIFIQREQVDFMFYNGQDEGRLTSKNISKYKKIVDELIKNLEHPPLKMFRTEIFGEEIIKAKDKMEVARKIKGFCLAVSGQPIEKIAEEQIIEEVV